MTNPIEPNKNYLDFWEFLAETEAAELEKDPQNLIDYGYSTKEPLETKKTSLKNKVMALWHWIRV